MKLNNNASAKEIRKQVSEEVIHKIDVYFVKINITTTKLCATWTLSSGNIAIQIISIEEVKKLRKENN